MIKKWGVLALVVFSLFVAAIVSAEDVTTQHPNDCTGQLDQLSVQAAELVTDPSRASGNSLVAAPAPVIDELTLRRREVANNLIDQYLKRRSDYFKRALSREPFNGVLRSFNVIIVGGGLHGAIVANTLRVMNPALSVLVVSKDDVAAPNFRRQGRVIYQNSPELGERSANYFPHSKLQVKDLYPGEKFPLLESLAALSAVNMLTSEAQILFESEVTEIDFDKNEITVNQLGKFRADYIVAATGPGVRAAHIEDEATQALIAQEMARNLTLQLVEPRGIEFYDDANERWAQLVDAKMAPLLAYEGKRVAIIGSADAANGLSEDFSGLGPKRLYGYAADGLAEVQAPDFKIRGLHGPAKVAIYNEKARDIEEFKKLNKARYHKTCLGFFCSAKKFPGHALRIEKNVRADAQQKVIVEFTVTANDGSKQTYDHVLIATGYANNLKSIFRGANVDLEPFRGPYFDYNSQQAGQTVLSLTNHQHRFFAVGVGAGHYAAPEVMQNSITKNGASLNVLGGLSAGLAVQIAQWPMTPAFTLKLKNEATPEKLRKEKDSVMSGLVIPP